MKKRSSIKRKKQRTGSSVAPATRWQLQTYCPGPKQPKSFVQFMRESPLMGSGINLEREEDYGRAVDL